MISRKLNTRIKGQFVSTFAVQVDNLQHMSSVRCQALFEVIKLYVVDMPAPNLHVVLGQCWLTSSGLFVMKLLRRGVRQGAMADGRDSAG